MTQPGPISTVTAPHARRQAWLVQQHVTGLRVFGTSIEKALPASFDALRIGSAPDCELAYLHPTVSKRHGMLRATAEGLAFHEWADPPPKNGSFCEGERRSFFQIVPGTWFALGGLELVAFSHESQQQRAVLARYLGYGEAAQHSIDRLYYGITRDRHLALIGPDGACRALARLIRELRGEADHRGSRPRTSSSRSRSRPTSPPRTRRLRWRRCRRAAARRS